MLALDGLLRADEGLGACATLIVLVKAIGTPDTSAGRTWRASPRSRSTTRRFRGLITPEQLTVAQLNDAAVAARTSPDFLVDQRPGPGRRGRATCRWTRSSRPSAR